MQIYAVADIHGRTDKLEQIKTTIHKTPPDLLVIAGDITNYTNPLKTLDRLKDIPVPILAVRGNSDLKRVEPLLQHQKNIRLLNHVPLKCDGVEFLGLNGTLPLPFLSKIRFRETPCLEAAAQKITCKTILVVHPPPRGICDRVGNRFRAGSIGLRRLIETHSPQLVLCGHIHEQAGYQFFRNCLVVNCAMNKKFSGAMIACDKDMPLQVEMVEYVKPIKRGP